MGFTPFKYQAPILYAVADHPDYNPHKKRRIVWHSGHNVGKSALLSCLAFWFSATHPGSIVIDTAPTYERQVVKIFWGELRKWVGSAADETSFEMRKSSLIWKHNGTFPDGTQIGNWMITGESASQREKIAGFHSPHGTMVLIDEASGVDDGIFEALEGAVSDRGSDTWVILTGNPTKRSGEFYRAMYAPELADTYIRIRTSSAESPRVAPTWIEHMRSTYGEDSGAFRSRVLGLPPDDNSDSLIPYSAIEEARNRWQRRKDRDPDVPPLLLARPRIGVDVARFGDDDSVICERYENWVAPLKVMGGFDNVQVADKVFQALRDCGGVAECISADGVGYGAGVVDTLRRLVKFVPIRDINVSTRSSDPETFLNLRAELAWRMRTWFLGCAAEIPPDEDLALELQNLRVTFESGRTQLESKENMKRRIGRSPDRADALMLTFAGPSAIDWEGLAKMTAAAREGRQVAPFASGVRF